jgi:hypothetical protein
VRGNANSVTTNANRSNCDNAKCQRRAVLVSVLLRKERLRNVRKPVEIGGFAAKYCVIKNEWKTDERHS